MVIPTLDLHPHDPRMLERKDEYRRRHKWADEHCGTGRRLGSKEALLAAKKPLVPCGREGCAALVQLMAAWRAARTGGRELAVGDGCGARSCASRHRPGRFAATQRRWAMQLLTAARPLVARPVTISQQSAAIIAGDRLVAAAHAALAALPQDG